MDDATLTQDADLERTKRAFVGFLSSVLGVDQSYSRQDAYIGNRADQFTIADPQGNFSQVGQPVSNLNQPLAAAGVTPGMLLLVAGLVFLLAK
jgi:hypothetical protein